MLGAICGDIIGEPFEWNHWPGNLPLFQPGASFTDDTICTIAIADALLNQRPAADALRDWCNRYVEVGGFGQRFAIWLGADNPTQQNSKGNGAGMRPSSSGLLASSLDEAISFSRMVTAPTHNSDEGYAAAGAVATSIYLARTGASKDDIRSYVTNSFGYDLSRTVDQIRSDYRYTELADKTVPEAITCVLEASSFEQCMRLCLSLQGDADTLCACAGGIAEALYGIPEDVAAQGWSCLPDDMRTILRQLYRHVQ